MTAESVGLRIRQLRQARGLSAEELAQRIGVNIAWYHDVEAYPSEVSSTLSLAQLARLAKELELVSAALLLGESFDAEAPSLGRTALVAELQRAVDERRQPIDVVSAEIGWDVSALLGDPEQLAAFNVDGLRDLCDYLGVDWVAALRAF